MATLGQHHRQVSSVHDVLYMYSGQLNSVTSFGFTAPLIQSVEEVMITTGEIVALAGSGTAVAVCVMSVASAGTWHRQVVTSQWQSVAVCGNLCHVRGISTSLHILKLSFAQFLFVLNFLILSKYTLLSVHNIA